MRSLVLLAAILTLAVSAPMLSATPKPQRVVGYGQVRFNGLGPERWAARSRAWRRTATTERSKRLQAEATVRTLQRRLVLQRSDLVELFRGLVRDLLCVHGREGSWGDDGAPYWGGLQMDAGFMADYAPKKLLERGTANAWTPLQQMAVGIIGWSLQGHFAPWPETSRACGLR